MTNNDTIPIFEVDENYKLYIKQMINIAKQIYEKQIKKIEDDLYKIQNINKNDFLKNETNKIEKWYIDNKIIPIELNKQLKN
jgi:hypothetical protein